MNDVRKMIYVTLIGFLAVVVLWLSLLYVSACGFTFSCNKYKPVVERTSIPTLIPVKRSGTQTQAATTEFNKCEVSATALIAAWVSAGAPETDAFPFSDVNGQPCEGTFEADIQRLFVENSLWYPGAIGCVSCHNAALTERSAGLDLTSYEAMQMGSSRTDANAKGSDIFGGGNWEKSTLFTVLVNQGMVPIGHSADVSANDFMLYAGTVVEPTATPSP